VNQSSPNFFR